MSLYYWVGGPFRHYWGGLIVGVNNFSSRSMIKLMVKHIWISWTFTFNSMYDVYDCELERIPDLGLFAQFVFVIIAFSTCNIFSIPLSVREKFMFQRNYVRTEWIDLYVWMPFLQLWLYKCLHARWQNFPCWWVSPLHSSSPSDTVRKYFDLNTEEQDEREENKKFERKRESWKYRAYHVRNLMRIWAASERSGYSALF